MMKDTRTLPSIHIPIQDANGSVRWVWYMFFQWIADNAGKVDLSDYFTKEETQTLLDAKANIDDLEDVAFSGSYNDLSDKPVIPTVNNATLTIQKNGTTVETFTANAPSDVTANITVPTKISDLTNDSNFANTDLSNLSSVGKNISNWSSNITNCITEIPQDIKLELNNGTLTLKAGSKVYVPNGVGSFDELIIQNDLTTINTWGQQVQLGLFVKSDGSTMFIINMEERCSSGSSAPTATNIQMWYDTTNNLVKRYAGGADTGDRYSLPIALVQKGDAVESSNISRIDQVFNGFGYIGSTRFALPGIKWLSPDRRNADGTLKSIQRTNTNVLVETVLSGTVNNIVMVLGTTTIWTSGKYIESETEPSGNYIVWYKPSENILRDKAEGNWTINNNVVVYGYYDAVSNQITSFRTKQSFHAFDYNDLLIMTLNTLYPVGSIYLGTQNTCPMSIVMPGTTWELVGTGRALWGGDGTNGGTTISAGLPNITGGFGNSNVYKNPGNLDNAYGAFVSLGASNGRDSDGGASNRSYGLSFDASRCSSVYRNDVTTVQPPAYRVNVWRRTA